MVFIIATQDQTIKNSYNRNKILKDDADPMCRKFQETIGHTVAGGPELDKTKYLHRHYKAATYLHCNICKEYNINIQSKWNEYEPQTMSENYDITIL